MRSKGFTLMEVLVVVFILAIVLGIGLTSCGACGGIYKGYSDGKREGVVYKLSKKGLVYKSYEGSLRLVSKDASAQTMMTNTWDFSVEDEAIAKEIESSMGKFVILTYTQYWKRPVSLDTDYIITNVDVVD